MLVLGVRWYKNLALDGYLDSISDIYSHFSFIHISLQIVAIMDRQSRLPLFGAYSICHIVRVYSMYACTQIMVLDMQFILLDALMYCLCTSPSTSGEGLKYIFYNLIHPFRWASLKQIELRGLGCAFFSLSIHLTLVQDGFESGQIWYKLNVPNTAQKPKLCEGGLIYFYYFTEKIKSNTIL